MVHISVVDADQITSEQSAAWRTLQRAYPEFDSPFFHPGFTECAAAVRTDVEVAVLEQDGQPVGFFPYQRGRGDIGVPVGGKLSEFHGVIAPPELPWKADELLAACRLKAWYFDHLIAGQIPFGEFHLADAASPYMDLRGGFDAYLERRADSGLTTYKQTLRKARKLGREVGEVRFEYFDTDPASLDKLIRWKTEQHIRTNRVPVFRCDWLCRLLQVVQHSEAEGFQGVCSTLSVGKRLIAVHLGLRSQNALHMWFPAYDRDFEKYSPGLILLVQIAKACTERGIGRIDFGPGPERYKSSFKTGALPLWKGVAETRRVAKLLRPQWYALKRRVRSSRWQHRFEDSMTIANRVRDRLAFR